MVQCGREQQTGQKLILQTGQDRWFSIKCQLMPRRPQERVLQLGPFMPGLKNWDIPSNRDKSCQSSTPFPQRSSMVSLKMRRLSCRCSIGFNLRSTQMQRLQERPDSGESVSVRSQWITQPLRVAGPGGRYTHQQTRLVGIQALAE